MCCASEALANLQRRSSSTLLVAAVDDSAMRVERRFAQHSSYLRMAWKLEPVQALYIALASI